MLDLSIDLLFQDLMLDIQKLKNKQIKFCYSFWYQSKSFIGKIRAFDDALKNIKQIYDTFAVDKHTTIVYVDLFLTKIKTKLTELSTTQLNAFEKRFFKFLPRETIGYYKSINKCLKLLEAKRRALIE